MRTRRLSWGTGIAMVYAAFAASTTGMVAFAMTHPVDLVSSDYYARSEQYDERMAAVERAGALGTRVSVAVDPASQSLIIMLPATDASIAHGTVQLYRASSARYDRRWPLVLDASGLQRVS